jgi:hypothetical protein
MSEWLPSLEYGARDYDASFYCINRVPVFNSKYHLFSSKITDSWSIVVRTLNFWRQKTPQIDGMSSIKANQASVMICISLEQTESTIRKRIIVRIALGMTTMAGKFERKRITCIKVFTSSSYVTSFQLNAHRNIFFEYKSF